MKKIYLLSFSIFILFLILIILFHNKIINFSLPLVKDRIQQQLSILENENTELKVRTDFVNKVIILNINKPFFKNNEYFTCS